MHPSPSSLLRTLSSRKLAWHPTEQPGYFICEEVSGKRTYLTPADLYRIDSRLGNTLKWYAPRFSAETTGVLLQKTIRFWLASFHLPWSAPGLLSPFCFMDEAISVEHISARAKLVKLAGTGIGMKHCNGNQIAVEHNAGTMTYAFDTLVELIPQFNGRLREIQKQPQYQWADTLFSSKLRTTQSVETLPDDIAVVYEGLLF